MNKLEKIEYMELCLKVAKEELIYKNEYENEQIKEDNKEKEDKHHYYNNWRNYFYNSHRSPSNTLINENLKNVARMAFAIAREEKMQ